MWGEKQLKGLQRGRSPAAETKRAGTGTPIFSSLKCGADFVLHLKVFLARVQRSAVTPASPPLSTLSASLPRKWHLSKARAHERGSHEHQAPLPCEVPQSQSWLVDLRRGGAKIQGGRSVEPSRSPVPNPAINSLLVHVVDLH